MTDTPRDRAAAAAEAVARSWYDSSDRLLSGWSWDELVPFQSITHIGGELDKWRARARAALRSVAYDELLAVAEAAKWADDLCDFIGKADLHDREDRMSVLRQAQHVGRNLAAALDAWKEAQK